MLFQEDGPSHRFKSWLKHLLIPKYTKNLFSSFDRNYSIYQNKREICGSVGDFESEQWIHKCMSILPIIEFKSNQILSIRKWILLLLFKCVIVFSWNSWKKCSIGIVCYWQWTNQKWSFSRKDMGMFERIAMNTNGMINSRKLYVCHCNHISCFGILSKNDLAYPFAQTHWQTNASKCNDFWGVLRITTSPRPPNS